jgi:hypothetical protein
VGNGHNCLPAPVIGRHRLPTDERKWRANLPFGDASLFRSVAKAAIR